LHVQSTSGGRETISINPSNLLELPELTVIKTVEGSLEAPGSFQMQIVNTADASIVHQFAGSAGTTYQLQPGVYSVDEVDEFC
jgi:hypothetical protein